MHAYLIVGTNTQEKEKALKNILKKQRAREIDFELKKIQEVRELGKFTKLNQSEKTAILIRDADKASTAALNAFLKALEEPQENISFFLTASSKYKLPETIVSRCIVVKADHAEVDRKTREKVKSFFDADISQKAKVLEEIKGRDEALEFLENLTLGGHEILTQSKSGQEKIAKSLKAIKETRGAIAANANVALQLTNLLVKLS